MSCCCWLSLRLICNSLRPVFNVSLHFSGIQTARLRFRLLNDADAEFILRLLNEPGWLQYIGDRGVHTLDDAKNYIHSGPLSMIRAHGFGLYLVERKEDKVPVGICGLLQRTMLTVPDLGFAYCTEFYRQGIAFEAGDAMLTYAKNILGLSKVAALTALDNEPSMALLKKLGFEFERKISLSEQTEASTLFSKIL